MKPIFIYSGGISRELKRINEIIVGIKFDRVVEPFMGGGAFSFDQEKPALVSDIRTNNIDVYKAVQDEIQFKFLLEKVEELKLITDRKELEKEFYYWRDEKYQNCNVPYGWYPKFTTKLSIEYHNLLKTWEIKECSFEESIDVSNENDFIFIDPPYLERNSDYGSNDHSLELHEKLFECLNTTKVKWLLIHTRHPFYEKHYKNYNILTKDFQYASQWKGRKQTDRKVEHLYITNFEGNYENSNN